LISSTFGGRWRRAGLTGLVLFLTLSAAFCYPAVPAPLSFPSGKKFAFTIVDDTDMSTLERLQPLYEILERYGLRTTKTVWVKASNNENHPANRGVSLSDPAYRQFIVGLQQRGFEIALHGVRGGDSMRQDTIDGIEEFKTILGAYPAMQVNHSINRENLYWGAQLYSTPISRMAARFAIRHPFDGHEPSSPYFWGDYAKQHIKFVRRFTLSDINLYSAVPSMPYHLDDKPFVNYWFPTANGNRILEFDELLKTENLDRLESEGGICIVYAHLGSGSFNRDGGATPDPRFEQRIKAVAARNGWFVPASTILEFLMTQQTWTGRIGWRDQLKLEAKSVIAQMGIP
jgi:hypothetical protein